MHRASAQAELEILLQLNLKNDDRDDIAPSNRRLKDSPSQATGNLPGKDFGLFLMRSLTPQQAAGNALAVPFSRRKNTDRIQSIAWRFSFLITALLLLLSSSAAFAQTYAYIPGYEDRRVVRINTANNSVSEVTLGCRPYGAAVVPSGAYALVTCEDTGQLVKITNANFTGSGTPALRTVGRSPRGVAVDTAGRYAYVANYDDDTVTEILLSSFSESTIPIDVGAGPWAVAAYYDEASETTLAYVGNFDAGTISVIQDGSLFDTFPVAGRPIGLALSPNGARLYVAENHTNGTGSVAVVRTADRAIIQRIDNVNAEGPWGLALGSDGGCLYITRNAEDQSGSIGMISMFFPADGSLVDLTVAGRELTGVGAPKNGDFALSVSRLDDQVYRIDAGTPRAEPIGGVPIDGGYALGAFIGGTPPSAPSAFSAAIDDHDTVTLTWTDNANDELGFKIERRIQDETAFAQIAVVGADALDYTDDGLTGSTTYEYRIRAYGEASDSPYVALSDAVTTIKGPFSWCFIGTLVDPAPYGPIGKSRSAN